MICASGSGEVENVKLYRRTTGDQKSSLELSAQVRKKCDTSKFG
jgi:hypothetical protein